MKIIFSPLINLRLVISVALLFSLNSFADSLVTVSSPEAGTYLLQGKGIKDVSAFDITISYDKDTLSNPQIVAGELIADSMMEINPNIPGQIRIAIIRNIPVTGDGTIATLNFSRKSSGYGEGIISVQVKAANTNDISIPVFTRINN